MKKILTLAALVGVTGVGVANAAPVTATMVSVGSYSKSAASASPWTPTASNTATWTFDTATNTLAMSGGTYSYIVKVGATALMTHTMTGVSMSTGNATGSTWTCTEGVFGGIVGSHICGNYSFGGNFTNESTYNQSTPDAISATVTIGGDDASLTGGPQTLVNSYSNFTAATPVAGAAVGFQRYTFNNGQDLVPGAGDTATGFDAGYLYTFDIAVVPAADAVDDGPFDVLEATATPLLTPAPASAPIGANDTGFTDPVTVTIDTQATKGTATVTTPAGAAAGQSISYTSNVGQTGTDTFVYSMTDGINTNTATVTVNILEFGANDDSYTTTRGVALTGLTPGANDQGFTPDTVTITAGACSSGDGTIAVTAGNGGPKASVLVTYTPPTNNPTSGSATTLNDSCAYTIDNGTASDTANILVAVTNSVPVANDGNASAISTAGAAPAGLTATFTSPGTGGSLGNAGVTTAGNGTHGTTSVAGNVITYTITDASFFTGSDTFTYTVTDADGAASDEVDTGTVTVTIANVAPTIADRAITTDVDTASTGNALTITAGNGSPTQHTLAVTTDGDNGNCTLSAANATGTLTYTPDAGYTGDDECVVTLTDGDGQTDTATITVTVNAEDEITLPGGSSSMDLWSLSLLGSLPLLMRRRRRS
jgi:hypothetical protein